MTEQYHEVCKEQFNEIRSELKYANKDIKEIREKLFNGHTTAIETTIPDAIEQVRKLQFWLLGVFASVFVGGIIYIIFS